MFVVTSIRPQKKRKRFNIYLDGEFAFGVSDKILVKAGLAVNGRISEKEIEKLKKQDQQGGLYDQALRFLSYRPRSEKEVRDYLQKKGGPIGTTEGIISELKKQDLIDDRAFTEWWLEQRKTFRPRGKFALMMELKQKGIDEELIKDALERLIDEASLVKRLIEKRAKNYKNLDQRSFRRKMIGFLARRGFNWPIIQKVLEEMKEKR